MAVKIIREVVGCSPKNYAGYGDIALPLAIQFLNINADEEARKEKCTVRENNSEQDGKVHYERILTNNQGIDVVRFYLKFTQGK
jgi:hypothetical protein